MKYTLQSFLGGKRTMKGSENKKEIKCINALKTYSHM